MSNLQETYTYRAGQKVVLEKRPDQFVVRALPDQLRDIGIMGAEQVSSASARVTTRAADLEPLMSRARHLAVTHHAYYVAETGQELLITDRIFVTFREPLPSDQVDAFAGRYGLIKEEAYSDRDYLFQLTDHTGMNPVKLVVKLTEEEPLVQAAEHDLNQRMSTYQPALPTDPAYARQWHLHARLADPAFDPRSSSRCEEAWQLLNSFGSADVVVGITDDGCKLDHPDFDSPDKFAGWGYFRGQRLITHTDIDSNLSEMHKPGSNHGTSCAGVIGAEVDAVLTVGAAPGCRLLPIQWESSGPSLFISDSKMLTVLNHIADKVDVLSNSWGGVPDNLWALNVVNRIAQLAQTGGRRGRGIVFLWAAGNENCPIQHTATVDIPYTRGWDPNGAPVWVGVQTARQFRNNLVGIPGVMHVAALASNAQRSHYSNYGTGIGICAPTSNSHEYRRLTVTGLGITTTTGSADGVTNQFGGTSSATPLVGADGSWSPWFGHGRVHTSGAVAEALRRRAPQPQQTFRKTSTPALAIPDNNPTGVRDTINFPDAANLSSIKVTIDVTHTFIGDLRLTLMAPSGTNVVLHSRNGGNADNIQRSFDLTSTPGLAALSEQSIQGNWTLLVQDLAAIDIGKLNRWELEIGGQVGAVVEVQETQGMMIPDNNPSGIERTLTITEAGLVKEVSVSVDITHTYIGDLLVSLVSPSGTNVVLHQRTGGSADNLIATYTAATTSALQTLRGQALQGAWKLKVADLEAVDVGKLNRWGLKISR